jgi:predicted RNase H-like nuclease (RuvC/YqgF family)
MTGPPGLSPAYEDDIAVFDIDELELDAATTQAFERIEELKGENEDLRLTIDSLNALNTSMQAEYQECEGLLKAEVESLASEVAKLQVQLCNSRGVSTIIYGYVSYTELF